MEGNMTDRRDDRDHERRKRTEEEDKGRREDKERRSDDLKEAWRRNHPSEQDSERGRRDKGRRT
jgi:hypothetical protein